MLEGGGNSFVGKKTENEWSGLQIYIRRKKYIVEIVQVQDVCDGGGGGGGG